MKFMIFGGASPQAGIDIEKNRDEEFSNNIKIYKNKFYNISSKNAILTFLGITNLYIYNNEIYNAKIAILYPNETIKVYENIIE